MNIDLEFIPKRIFLDTNIIQNILEYDLFNEETINENILLPQNQLSKQADLYALKFIYLSNIRGNFQFITSTRNVRELIDSRKRELINWGIEFLDYSKQFIHFERKDGKLQPTFSVLKKKIDI